MMGIHNGFMDSFYGALLIIGGFGSIYGKRIK
jgi:ethanolamine utilization microcompartment shell protein EutS